MPDDPPDPADRLVGEIAAMWERSYGELAAACLIYRLACLVAFAAMALVAVVEQGTRLELDAERAAHERTREELRALKERP